MTRLLSPFPPHHVRCALGSVVLPPAQVAGILDGDGCFVITARGPRHHARPRVSLVMRDDDPTPLACWRSVAAWHGAPLGWLRHSHEYRRHEWHVDSVADLLALTGWLTRFPPLSPRAWRQLAAVREATLILAESGPAGDRHRVPVASEARLSELMAAIPDRAPVSEPLPPSPTMATASEQQLGWFLSGLTAAEGHLALVPAHGRYAPRFSINQVIDNEALLKGLRGRTGLGTVVVRPGQRGYSPQAWWIVTRIDEIARLIALLRAYPLPPSSPKASQVDLLAAALPIRRPVADGGLPLPEQFDALAALHAQLRDAKRYRGRRWLCECVPPTNPSDSERG